MGDMETGADMGASQDGYVEEKLTERGYPGIPMGHGGGPPKCPNCKRQMQYDGPGMRCYTCGIFIGPGGGGSSQPGFTAVARGGVGGNASGGGRGGGMGMWPPSGMWPPPGLGPVPAAPLPGVDEKKAAEILSRPACFVEKTSETSINYEFTNLTTQEARDIIGYILPEILNRFLTKNKDYEHFPEGDLGPKAHFVGIHRKFGKLRKGLWDGEALEHEQVSEVIDDFIGHLLLARLGLE